MGSNGREFKLHWTIHQKSWRTKQQQQCNNIFKVLKEKKKKKKALSIQNSIPNKNIV